MPESDTTPAAALCDRCDHAADEHSIYGCLDECGCPNRPDLKQGASGRTETGATTANVQVGGGEAGDSGAGNLRTGLRQVLGIGSPAVTDHDLIEHVRAAIIYRFRADQEVLLKDTVLTRERERADAAEAAMAAGIPLVCSDERHGAKVASLEAAITRARSLADRIDQFADTTCSAPDVKLYRAFAHDIRKALTPPADQDRGGQ